MDQVTFSSASPDSPGSSGSSRSSARGSQTCIERENETGSLTSACATSSFSPSHRRAISALCSSDVTESLPYFCGPRRFGSSPRQLQARAQRQAEGRHERRVTDSLQDDLPPVAIAGNPGLEYPPVHCRAEAAEREHDRRPPLPDQSGNGQQHEVTRCENPDLRNIWIGQCHLSQANRVQQHGDPSQRSPRPARAAVQYFCRSTHARIVRTLGKVRSFCPVSG